jgi:hypothetical protein
MGNSNMNRNPSGAGGFRPGQSGNPGGRPKVVAEVRAAAMQYTSEAIETLATIMRNERAPLQARAAAANSLLDRAIGRPEISAKIENTTTSTAGIDFDRLTPEELDALTAKMDELVPLLQKAGAMKSDESQDLDRMN